MQNFITTCTALFLFLGNVSFAQAPPEQMVPLPAFADEQGDLSAHVSEVTEAIGGDVREGSIYENGQLVRYQSVEQDIRVFTTSLPIEEVREQYLSLMLDGMAEEGMPPEALEQYRGFLESEVLQPVTKDALFPGDLDMIEHHYAQAGIVLPDGYMHCLHELEAELEGQDGAFFSLEMDERQFRQRDPVPPGGYFTIVEVEVHEPYLNTLECKIMDKTTIIYKAYRMQLSE